jgi:hypothetical protein
LTFIWTTLSLLVILLPMRAVEVYYLRREWKKLDARISKLEIAIVAQVMEENPQILESVLSTYERLNRTYVNSKDALKEARRLHGLDP